MAHNQKLVYTFIPQCRNVSQFLLLPSMASVISSMLLPRVSGMNSALKNTPNRQHPAKVHMQPCIPSTSTITGKYFITMKLTTHRNVVQRDPPKLRSFCGKISDRITKVNGRIPQAAMNIVNDKLATGIQLIALTSYPDTFR